jgi:hypothetical protein
MSKTVVTWFETKKKCKDYDDTALEKHLMKRDFVFNLNDLFVDDKLYFEFPVGSDRFARLLIEVRREIADEKDELDVEREHDRRIRELATIFDPWLESKGWSAFVVCERPKRESSKKAD